MEIINHAAHLVSSTPIYDAETLILAMIVGAISVIFGLVTMCHIMAYFDDKAMVEALDLIEQQEINAVRLKRICTLTNTVPAPIKVQLSLVENDDYKRRAKMLEQRRLGYVFQLA